MVSVEKNKKEKKKKKKKEKESDWLGLGYNMTHDTHHALTFSEVNISLLAF